MWYTTAYMCSIIVLPHRDLLTWTYIERQYYLDKEHENHENPIRYTYEQKWACVKDVPFWPHYVNKYVGIQLSRV